MLLLPKKALGLFSEIPGILCQKFLHEVFGKGEMMLFSVFLVLTGFSRLSFWMTLVCVLLSLRFSLFISTNMRNFFHLKMNFFLTSCFYFFSLTIYLLTWICLLIALPEKLELLDEMRGQNTLLGRVFLLQDPGEFDRCAGGPLCQCLSIVLLISVDPLLNSLTKSYILDFSSTFC